VPDGPPDLDAIVAHPARIVGVPAEERQGVLDELAVPLEDLVALNAVRARLLHGAPGR
jgi:hypothetical protein